MIVHARIDRRFPLGPMCRKAGERLCLFIHLEMELPDVWSVCRSYIEQERVTSFRNS
jgi:hypothetical protein